MNGWSGPLLVVVDELAETANGSGDEDDLVHVVCCDPTWTLCGHRLPEDEGWVWDDGLVDCVVCRDLKGGPCRDPECGFRE